MHVSGVPEKSRKKTEKGQKKDREKMLYIQEMHEGMKVAGIYLCKSRTAAVTKNGKNYDNVILMDKTGTIDAKIWEPDSAGIDDFDAL